MNLQQPVEKQVFIFVIIVCMFAGYGGNIYRIGFRIPQEAKNYKDFCKKISLLRTNVQ